MGDDPTTSVVNRYGWGVPNLPIVLIGGLLTSTVLTLVFVPAMYTIFDDIECAFARQVRCFGDPPPAPGGRLRQPHPHRLVHERPLRHRSSLAVSTRVSGMALKGGAAATGSAS